MDLYLLERTTVIKKLVLLLIFLSPNVQTIASYSVDTLEIYSNTLKENRQIRIFRPEGIQSTDSISIIYLLDGESGDYYYKIITDELAAKPLIGIGIVNTDRRRDLLAANEADKFLEFIVNELIPTAEAGLSVKERILFGHSFGGAFTVYSLITRPGLFNKYIASSPTPIMKMVDPPRYQKLDAALDKTISFYFSYGSEDLKQVISWAKKLNEALLILKFDHIRWKRDVFAGENHNTSNAIALINGIRF